jgi:hypothetical protein
MPAALAKPVAQAPTLKVAPVLSLQQARPHLGERKGNEDLARQVQ